MGIGAGRPRRPTKDLSCCISCYTKLRKVSKQRTSGKRCTLCRLKFLSNTAELRHLPLNLKKNPPEVSEDEEKFEDDPRGVNEVQYGKVFNTASLSSSETTLSDVMV